MPLSPTVIIVLDHAGITGGQAQVAFSAARGLREHGAWPIIFAPAGIADPSLVADGIEVVALGQADILDERSRLKAAARGIWNAEAADALGVLLAAQPRDRTIVHVHGWAKAASPAIARPIIASGLPAVATLHEYFMFCPNGGFFNHQTQRICGLAPMSRACVASHCDSRNYPTKLWRVARHRVMERVAHLPSAFADYVTISRFQRGIVEPLLPAGARLHEIANPIEAPDLGPKPDPCAGEIVFVGRISPEKGPLLYAQAARLAGVRPVFVGDGPQAAELRAAYPEARMLGWRDAAGVRAALRGARALVFPSLWYEGQPLTVLEAKALGTPVIVSDACAGRESIEHGVSGLWFRSGDAAELAAAMTRLADDGLTRTLAHGAYANFWRAPPTRERHAQALLALYADMLAPARVAETVA